MIRLRSRGAQKVIHSRMTERLKGSRQAEGVEAGKVAMRLTKKCQFNCRPTRPGSSNSKACRGHALRVSGKGSWLVLTGTLSPTIAVWGRGHCWSAGFTGPESS
jgi:hypothetical protein